MEQEDQNEVNSINSDLIRGHIDTIILKALQNGDRYGYDIIKEIEHKSDGQYIIKQPTLYSCLKRLEVQGFVKSYWGSKSIGGRKKYFTLTDLGRELFLRNKNDWDYSRTVIDKLISDDDYSAASYDAQLEPLDNQSDETTQPDAEQNFDEAQDVTETEAISRYEQTTSETVPENDEDDEQELYLCETFGSEESKVRDYIEPDEPDEVPYSYDEENSDDEVREESEQDLDEVEPKTSEDDEQELYLCETFGSEESKARDYIEPSEPNEVPYSYDEENSDNEVREDEVTDEQNLDDEPEFYEDEHYEERYDEDEVPYDEARYDEDEQEEIYDNRYDDEPYEDEVREEQYNDEQYSEDKPYDDENEPEPSDEESYGPSDDNGDDDREDDLPLAAAEQYRHTEEEAETDDNEILDGLYDEVGRESYINSVEHAEYRPPKDDDIDVNNYFVDDIDESDYADDEVAAGAEVEAKEEEIPYEEPRAEYRRVVNDTPADTKTVFYSYKQSIPYLDERAAIVDKEYRGVISSMMSNVYVAHRPQPVRQAPQPTMTPVRDEEPQAKQKPQRRATQESETKDLSAQIESDTGDRVNITTYTSKTVKEYNNKHFYYSNQLRLLQCGILFGVMLLEIILCFFFIEVQHNKMQIGTGSIVVYVLSIVLAASFPITAFFMASSNYYKRKRINYSAKSSAIFSVVAFILVSLIVLFVNIYAGLLIGNINNYLSPLILPIILASNLIVNAVIFHFLYTSGKYNLDD